MKKSGRSNQVRSRFGVTHLVGLVVLVGAIGYLTTRRVSSPVESVRVGDNLESAKLEQSLSLSQDQRWEMDVVGGFEGSGYVIVKEVEDKNAYEVFAELPELKMGKYVGWLINARDKHSVQLGDLQLSKAGWYLYFETKGDVSLYDKLIISLEEKEDEIVERRLMEIEIGKVR